MTALGDHSRRIVELGKRSTCEHNGRAISGKGESYSLAHALAGAGDEDDAFCHNASSRFVEFMISDYA